MKIQARYVSMFALALASYGCGDDADNTEEPITSASATDTSSGGPTTPEPASTSSSGDSTDTSESATGTADESSSSSSSSTGGQSPFEDCHHDVLEDDYFVVNATGQPGPPRWYGPGVDGGGNLIDDGESEYVVSVTYLTITPESNEMFIALATSNAMALSSNPGMVAQQLGGGLECLTGRTFTVWEDMAALMTFVSSPAHVQSISSFPQISRGGSYLSVWPEPVRVSEITLENAMARLADEVPYD